MLEEWEYTHMNVHNACAFQVMFSHFATYLIHFFFFLWLEEKEW